MELKSIILNHLSIGGGGLVAKLCLIPVAPWTVEPCQVPLSMGFPRKEYWSRLPFPPREDLLNPSPALAGGLFTTALPKKSQGGLLKKNGEKNSNEHFLSNSQK